MTGKFTMDELKSSANGEARLRDTLKWTSCVVLKIHPVRWDKDTLLQ